MKTWVERHASIMRFAKARARPAGLFCCLLILGACLTRAPSIFRVIPATPSYVLEDPNFHQTAFGDVLHNYAGASGGDWTDLHPAMELNIENAYYQPGASRHGLAGFLGTEIAHYRVQTGGLKLLSAQRLKRRPADQPSVQQLISPSQQHHHYFRLYSEIFFKQAGDARGSILLGANSRDGIAMLASELRRDPDAFCAAGSQHCTRFPEACSVTPEIAIIVNGARQNIFWGSALSSIVKDPKQLQLLRVYHGRLTPVRLIANDAHVLQLPLLPGDRIDWR